MPHRLNVAGGRARARLAIQRAMGEKGIASIDHITGAGSTACLLDEDFWPAESHQNQIELLLDWPYGTVEAIASRPPHEALDGPTHAIVHMVQEMEPADRTALMELLKVMQVRRRTQEAEGPIERDLRLILGDGAD